MNHINLIGKRIEFNKHIGTIKYSGKLHHEIKKKNINPEDHWLGIEWDSENRGTHFGKVKNFEYFECDKKKSGSLIKYSRINFGDSLILGYVKKYFKKKEIVEILKDEENVIKNLLDVCQNLDNKKKMDNTSEFDNEAIIKTSISYKKIEFLGFNNVWNIVQNVSKIKNLSLEYFKIYKIGNKGQLKNLFKNLKELSVCSNLFNDWSELNEIVEEFPNLEILQVSKNNFLTNEEVIELKSKFTKKFHPELEKNLIPKSLNLLTFKNLKVISLSNTNMNFKKLNLVKKLFLNVEEMILSFNNCNDFENIDFQDSDFQNLKKLDLSYNNIKTLNFQNFKNIRLERINLSFNKIEDLPFSKTFETLTHLNIYKNSIEKIQFLKQIVKFKKLKALKIQENPLIAYNDKDHIRCLIISCSLNLKILNGSELRGRERIDCEIYFLKNSFHEFFKTKKTDRFSYIVEEYLEFAKEKFPLIDYYLGICGNPYPFEERFLKTAKVHSFGEKDLKIKIGKNFCVLKCFLKNQELKEEIILEKKLPRKTDMNFIRNRLKKILKVKKNGFKIYGEFDEIVDDLKTIGDITESNHLEFRIVMRKK